MRKNQLVKLLIAAVVIGVIGFAVKVWKGKSWEKEDELIAKLVLPDFPVNDVQKLEITNEDGRVQLARKEGMWRVEQRHGYPADFDDISEFLRDLVDLKATQTVAVGPSQYGRLELLPPAPKAEGTDGADDESDDDDETATTGTEVKFYAAGDKLLATLMLGKEHEKKSGASPMGGMGGMGMGGMGGMGGGGGWPDGRFLLVPGSDEVVLVSKTFSSVTTKPKDWVEKDFFKIGDMETGKLTQGEETLWEVSREKKGDDMKLLGLEEGQEPEDSKVRSISNAFSWASFEDVVDPSLTPEETGMDNPKIFTATDFDGFTYTVKIGKENEDSKYYIAVDLEYDGPEEREPEEGESEEDKTKKDAEFKKKQDENKKKAEDSRKRVDGWVYTVSKYTVENVLKERSDLIEKKEVFKIVDMATGKLTQGDETLWEVKREKKGDDMKLVGIEEGQEPEDSKIRSISSAFSSASFEDVADSSLSAEETGMDNPKVFTATDFDGFTYTVKTGKENKDGKYYVAIDLEYDGPGEREAEEDESEEDKQKKDEEFKKKQEENRKKAEATKKRVDGWVYVVSKYTVENVLRERTDLIKKKEEKKDDAAKSDEDAKKAGAEGDVKAAAEKAAADVKETVDKAVEAVKQAAEGAKGAAAEKLDQMKKGTDAAAAKPAVKIE